MNLSRIRITFVACKLVPVPVDIYTRLEPKQTCGSYCMRVATLIVMFRTVASQCCGPVRLLFGSVREVRIRILNNNIDLFFKIKL